MRKLRVAVAGAGYFSRFHYDAWSRMGEVELVALCDRDAAKAAEAAGRWGIPRVYADVERMLDVEAPDLLDIVTPPDSHLSLVRAAAARGVAAICQKAFCRSLEEAEEAAALAERAGTLLVVHENFRFQPWYGEIKRLLGEGALGTVLQASFRLRPGDGLGDDAYLDRQPYFREMPRFLVHETAIHWVDTFRYLFGPVGAVMADLRRENPVIAGEDSGFILFRHKGGVRSLFDGNRLLDHAARDRRLTMGEFLVEGTAGALRLDGDGRLLRRPRGAAAEEEVRYQWNDTGFGGDCVFRLQRHVVDHLQRGTPLQNRAREYLENLRIERAIYESAAAGACKTLPETGNDDADHPH